MKLAWPINALFPPVLNQKSTSPKVSALKEEDGGWCMQIFKTEMTFVVSCALCLFIKDLSKCRESHCLKHKDTAQADLLHLLANGQQHDYEQEIGVFLTSVFT